MTLDDLDRQRRLARHLATGARIARGDPTVEVTVDDVVDLMRLTQPHLFGGTVDLCLSNDLFWNRAPAGPSLGQSVRWPDGSVSFAAGPHMPAGR